MLSALINKYKNYYLITGLTLWLFRPTGNDFYIIFVLLYFISIFVNKPTLINDPPINIKAIKIIIYISLALITTTLFMKFMSFGYHHMDLGLQHQLIINLVKKKSMCIVSKVQSIKLFAPCGTLKVQREQ